MEIIKELPKRVDWIWGTPEMLEYQTLLGDDNFSLVSQQCVRRIDLSKDLEEILSGMSSGHKSDIKQAVRNGVEIKIFDSENIDRKIWNVFLSAHKTTESRKKRNPKCWEILFELIKNGNAILVGADSCGEKIAFAYIFLYKSRGYYGLANIKDEYRRLKPSHLIHWTAIKYMKKNGILFYDLGTDCAGDTLTEKEKNIIKFKRGFGGFTFDLFKQP